jgi:hypothetical protein
MSHDDRHVTVIFRAVAEAAPGPKWQKIFRHGWPGWSAWFGRWWAPAEAARAERALRRHMPELTPLWERLVELAGGDARAAHFLTFWCPPRYLVIHERLEHRRWKALEIKVCRADDDAGQELRRVFEQALEKTGMHATWMRPAGILHCTVMQKPHQLRWL